MSQQINEIYKGELSANITYKIHSEWNEGHMDSFSGRREMIEEKISSLI